MTAYVPVGLPNRKVPAPGPSGPVQLACLVALAAYMHAVCWTTVPPDMNLFLFPWYQHILEHGPVGAFAAPFSNYTPPYLYLLAAASLVDGLLPPLTAIKLLSVAGTAFLAYAVAGLLEALGSDRRGALLVFLLPSVTLNSALLGQCDALWAGGCILAIAAMVRGRTVAALIWCGVAVAFKAQAAFIAPLIIGALIGRRTAWWQWAIPPLVYAALMLPAWLAGWPAADLSAIYLRQAGWFETPGNLANPWNWATQFAPAAAKDLYVAGYAAAVAAAAAIGAYAARFSGRPRALALLALISALAIPFLLPKMHERYYFLADALALALALAFSERRVWLAAAAVQLASLFALGSYIYNWPTPVLAGSLLAPAALAGLAIRLHHLAASHDEVDGLEHANVAQRVAGHPDDISAFAGLERPDLTR